MEYSANAQPNAMYSYTWKMAMVGGAEGSVPSLIQILQPDHFKSHGLRLCAKCHNYLDSTNQICASEIPNYVQWRI